MGKTSIIEELKDWLPPFNHVSNVVLTEIGVILPPIGYKVLGFLKSDVLEAEKGFEHISGKLNFKEYINTTQVVDFFEKKYAKIVEEKKFTISGKNYDEWDSDDRQKAYKVRIETFEACRVQLHNEIAELLNGCVISEKHKNLVIGWIRYHVGYHIRDVDGD